MTSLLLLLSQAIGQTPVPDECQSALPAFDGTNNGDNGMATDSLGAPAACAYVFKDVWYAYTASCSGSLGISLCGSTAIDSIVQVLSGACGSLTSIGCNDDACGVQSAISVPVTLGATYYIRIGSYDGIGGPFTMTLSCSPITPDDECAGAGTIVLGGNGPFHNSGYSSSLPAMSCGAGGSDRWFRFVAPYSAPFTFKTCTTTTGLDTVVEVMSGGCGTLTSLGCNDDTCATGSSVTVMLASSATYYVRVGGFGGAQGSFSLVVEPGSGTGNYVPSATAGCGPTALVLSGNPVIGSAVSITAVNVVGLPFVGLGFTDPGTVICGCTLGCDWSTAQFGSNCSVAVPNDPAYMGIRIYAQGADFLGVGGCAAPQLTLSDAWRITIG